MTRKRLPRVKWRHVTTLADGQKQFEDIGGMLMYRLSDNYRGTPLPVRYVLYQFKLGKWNKIGPPDFRSFAKMERYARERKAHIEDTENEET